MKASPSNLEQKIGVAILLLLLAVGWRLVAEWMSTNSALARARPGGAADRNTEEKF